MEAIKLRKVLCECVEAKGDVAGVLEGYKKANEAICKMHPHALHRIEIVGAPVVTPKKGLEDVLITVFYQVADR